MNYLYFFNKIYIYIYIILGDLSIVTGSNKLAALIMFTVSIPIKASYLRPIFSCTFSPFKLINNNCLFVF